MSASIANPARSSALTSTSEPLYARPIGERAVATITAFGSTPPVLRALSTPKILLVARFGAGLRASRTYAEVRERYLARLAEGVQAGRFAPKPLASSEQTEEQRKSLLADLDQVSESLTVAVSGWREWQMDRLRLPHPALGWLTVREMLFFTLYHNLHHVRNVERRMMVEP